MKKPQDAQKHMETSNSGNYIIGRGNKQNQNQKGSLEFSLGDLFKCVCCIHSGISHEEKRLSEVNQSLQQIDKRLNLLDRFEEVIYS